MIENENIACKYEAWKKDCDGDWDCYCMSPDHCPYERKVRDCDGDIIFLCRKE